MSTAAMLPASAPRWRTVALLTFGVLLVHLVLLTGGWSGELLTVLAPTASENTGATAEPSASAAGEAMPAAADTPVPVTTSRVRWIVPAPPPPPPPPPQPEPEPPVKAQATPPEPAPVTEPEALAAPPPEPEPEPLIEPVDAVEQAQALPEISEALAVEPEALLALSPAENEAPPLAETAPSLDAPALAAPLPPEEPPGPTPQADANTTTTAPASAAAPGAAVLQPDAELPPAQAPPSMRLMYQVTGRVKGINYNAAGSLEWNNEGARYNVAMSVRAFLAGSRGQTSEGSIAPTGLLPQRFTDKSRTERSALFDAEQRRIRFSNNAPEAEWVIGGQDRLSVFMQIASLLQARPDAYPQGATIALQVAGPGDAEVWRFEIGPEETLSLPAGNLRARLVTRTPRKAFDTRTELWLAPDLQHLPVRIRITQADGDHIEQALRYMP